MNLDNLITKYGLDKINSLTEYPSILTYHKLGDKGGLKNELIDNPPKDELLEVTEKVDGTNGRFIYLNGDYLIGARNKLVYARGDRIINSDIVAPIEKSLDKFIELADDGVFYVIYGEVYGHKIQDGSKVYCSDGCQDINFRVFDVWSMTIAEVDTYLSLSDQSKLTRDRENNLQPWFSTSQLAEFVEKYELQRTPIRCKLSSDVLPIGAEDTKLFIENNFKESLSTIGTGVGSNPKFKRAEGVVIRTSDRKFIRKLRFDDYDKGKKKNWQ